MLLFFCGMFIMVEGAVELGLMRKIAALITFIIDTAPVSGQKVGSEKCGEAQWCLKNKELMTSLLTGRPTPFFFPQASSLFCPLLPFPFLTDCRH